MSSLLSVLIAKDAFWRSIRSPPAVAVTTSLAQWSGVVAKYGYAPEESLRLEKPVPDNSAANASAAGISLAHRAVKPRTSSPDR